MPTISALFVYPVKSCGAIALDCVQLAVHGFPWDRHWMVIDENGRFVSQREFPAMARIIPTLTADALVLNSPMLPNRSKCRLRTRKTRRASP